MTETNSLQKENVFLEFLHSVKEYFLVIAMVIASLKYLSHYIEEISEGVYYLKWLLYIIIALIIYSLYFFTVRPTLIKRKELNLRPNGEPDKNYFTTSPRIEDKYNFFASGYEQYLEWLIQPKAPILYLTGSSGSGKSSLINAYLAPQLQRQIQKQTNVYLLRSYHEPLQVLFNALTLDTIKTVANEETVLDEIHKTSNLLSANEQILIVLDQFEEFFLLRNNHENLIKDKEETKGINELKNFFHLFIKKPPKNVYILLSYRDDFQQLIDQLELPARNEHINFEQVKLLTFEQASKFIKSCPGLEIPDKRLDSILKEASSIDTPIALRPIVLNLLGIIIQQMVGQKLLPKNEGNLIRQYIFNCLGKELQRERAAVFKAMLTDFKTAIPRTIKELSTVSKLSVSQLDNQMLSMQHYGLVRCIDTEETAQGERKWQIAHDFIAIQLEKVIYGIENIFWRKIRTWLAPIMISILIIFTLSYYVNKGEREKKKAISGIEKVGLTWIEQSRSIVGKDIYILTDSMFHAVQVDFQVLQPDTLNIEFWPSLFILSNEKYKRFTNLQGLRKVKSLKKINISLNDRINNIDDLRDLQLLVSLDLSSSDSLKTVDAIANLKNLTYLNLSYCSSLENVDAIKGLTKLSCLDLIQCSGLKNPDILKGLINLTDLYINSNSNINSTEPLKELTKLNKLIISDCENLVNVETLSSLACLEKLYLESCSNLKNINSIKYLKSLRILTLRNCSSIENIEVLKELKNLEEIDLSGCDKVSTKQITDLKNALPKATVSY